MDFAHDTRLLAVLAWVFAGWNVDIQERTLWEGT